MNKQLSQTCCVRLIEHIQILNCRDPSHNHWAMTLGFIRYTAVFRKYERPQFVTTVISEKLATSNDCKHNIICVEVCQNKNIQSNWTYSMQTSSSWIFRSTQYMQRLCVFILDCLAWHLSADNLWHIWCQSAITFLIKKKGSIKSWLYSSDGKKCSLPCSRAPDLWDLSFSQSTGYLGPDQGVSGRAGKWIYTAECLHGPLCGQMWDTCSTTS